MPHFDPQQTEAIQTTGTSILVSASAGAGKTGVLVARLVKRCVNDRIPLSRILAMTFTQAAAAEMKKRLAAELHARADQESDPDALAYLNQQLAALDSANITTIDSYCLTIIRKYYNVIGLDPATASNILSEGIGRQYRHQAFNDALHAFDERDHEGLLNLLLYFSPRCEDYDTLYDIVTSIDAHAQSAYDPKEWYKQASESYHEVQHFSDFDASVLDAFFDHFMLECRSLKESLSIMHQHAGDSEKIDPDAVCAKENALEACISEIERKDYSSYCQRLDHLAEIKTSADSKAAEYTAARKNMDSIIKKMLAERYDEAVLIHDSNDLSKLCRDLCTLSEDTADRFSQIKRENACMDFTDMERYAVEILNANNGETAAQIRDSLDEIMVDEFQDTSQLQNLIIEKIAKKDDVFRVGDIKQSIYRFRQAKPQLMRSLMENPSNHLITLRHNYRSKDSIVRFTNILFEKLMNAEGTSDSYSDADHVTIGADYQKEEQPVPVVFAEIRKPDVPEDSEDADESEDGESPDSKQLKADWIAEQILTEKKKNPDLHFRDFAVLVKSHSVKPYLRAAFDAQNIPYDIDAREGFFQSELCQTITAMCRACLDPSDSISLLSVLTSPWYSFTDEDIAEMKLKGGTLFKGVKLTHPEVFEDLNAIHEAAEKEGLEQMLTEIAVRHDFFNHLDHRQQANFDYLFQLAGTCGAHTLEQFIDIISASQDEKSSEAMSQGRDDDVVIVTTIHHSKGLQYNYVFLWGTTMNRFNDSSNPVIVDDDLHLGISHLDEPWRAKRKTVQRIAIEHRQNLEDLEEFIRLLYVALTRAQKRLYIVDVIKKPFPHQPASLPLFNSRKGMSGLILSTLDEGPYFHHLIVSPASAPSAVKAVHHYAEKLPVYHGPSADLTPILTPSETESEVLLPLDPSQKSSGTDYGTRMHEAAAALPDRKWTMQDLENFDLTENDKKKLLAFSDSSLYQQCLSMQIYKEYPFYINDGKVRMHGQFDFAAVGENEVILIDFKTDHAELSEIASRYQNQLNAYRHALGVLYHKPVRAYAWSFHNNAAVEIRS